MAITSFTIFYDPPEQRGTNLPFDGVVEFSRNERGSEIVKLTVIPDDLSPVGETITIRLMKARRDRGEEVVQARKTYTFTAGNTPVDPNTGVTFEYDLREIVYSAGKPFPVVRRGDYYFSVENDNASVEEESSDFRVALMTTDRFEEEWLLGTTRRSNDDRSVRFQPSQITGVRVIEVSRNHPLDLFPLTLSYGGESSPNKFLSWGNGQTVKVDQVIPTGIHKQYILVSRDRSSYIIVQVDPRKLPSADTTEMLMVDRQLISRDSLRRWLDEEFDWLERDYMFVPIEPALVVSDYDLSSLTIGPGSSSSQGVATLPANSDYDLKASPTSYYPPTAGHFLNLKVPYWRPLQWDYLVGSLENTRIVDVPVEFIHQGASGYINLIPFNQSLAYNFIGLMYVHALRGPVSLPSFWRYRYYAGIEDRTTPLPIIEVAGLRAAVKALAVLGQMFRGGFSSQSVSRDGVSESASYTASATFGIYSATIEEYKKRLKELEPQVKRRWFGVQFEGF